MLKRCCASDTAMSSSMACTSPTAVVEVDEGIGRPVLIAKFFAGYHFTRPLQQDR